MDWFMEWNDSCAGQICVNYCRDSAISEFRLKPGLKNALKNVQMECSDMRRYYKSMKLGMFGKNVAL